MFPTLTGFEKDLNNPVLNRSVYFIINFIHVIFLNEKIYIYFNILNFRLHQELHIAIQLYLIPLIQ